MSKTCIKAGVGIATMFIAVTTLLGWAIGSRVLVAWNADSITMKPFSAICVLIAGFAILLESIADNHLENDDAMNANIYKGMSSAAFIWLGLMQFLFLAEALILKISNINVFRQPGMELTWHLLQQTPSQITLSCLLLICAAHIYNKFVRTIGVILSAISSCVLLGYAVHKPEMYFNIPGWTTAVAINTAICFLLIGISLLVGGKYGRSTV